MFGVPLPNSSARPAPTASSSTTWSRCCAPVTDLAELRLVQSATAEIRTQPASPLFKLYIINGSEAFQGFDPLGEHAVNIQENSLDGEPISKDAPLFHQEATDDPEAVASQFVSQAATWFDSIWTNSSTEVSL